MKRITLSLTCLLLTTILNSQSRFEKSSFYSPSLGISKQFHIYLPNNYDTHKDRSYPVVYFLRQHENEWLDTNLRPDKKTLIDVLDELTSQGDIGDMIVVCPSTGGATFDLALNNFGIVNMMRPDLISDSGIGTGQFEDYFFNDLIPHIDSSFRTIPDWCGRGIDGFSLGGYASTLYTLKHPDKFCSTGSYDGTFMWYDFDDLRTPGPYDDDMYFNPSWRDDFQGMFGKPLDTAFMVANNPTNILVEANASKLDSLRQIAFHISSGSYSYNNRAVNAHFTDTLTALGISNSFDPVILKPGADHTYDHADDHAYITLPRHWQTFKSHSCLPLYSGIRESENKELSIQPNPASSSIQINGLENKMHGEITVSIISIDGQIELKTPLFSNHLDVSMLNQGIYIVVIESSSKIESHRFIKM